MRFRVSPVSVVATNELCEPDLLDSAGGGGRRHHDQFLQATKAIKKKGCGTPADADPYPPPLAERRAPSRARTPSGVPPRLSPRGLFIPKAQLQARLPGRGA
jgi:hypothetical protein